MGHGYDLHRLVKGRPLILGGLEIKHAKGLAGHSDADALIHAAIDALFGAARLGDIGEHFPDTDERCKNISSVALLAKAAAMVAEAGYAVVNVDATVIAERPRLGAYKTAMAEKIAEALHIEPGKVNVKAKTNEGLGEVGKGRAIAAHAVCLLVKNN